MKNWKNFLLIVLAMGLAFSLNAQEEPSWKQTLPRHDIQFGIGDPALLFLNNTDICIGCDYYPLQQNADSWFEDYVNALTFAAPTINFEYRYRFAKWFWFGAATSFTPIINKWSKQEPGNEFTDHLYFISIMPSVRFSWLNKKYVTLYSGLSIGCMVVTGSKYLPEERATKQQTWANFTGQLTAVGVQVGKKWYGFTEVGFGAQGFVKAGFGYKFQSNGKKRE